jgi:hypothetical protein
MTMVRFDVEPFRYPSLKAKIAARITMSKRPTKTAAM